MSADPNRLEHRLEHRLEQRGAQRFEMHLPLAVHFEGRTVPGFTQDLSGRGIFFYAETALAEGAVVELTFTMPSEITWGKTCRFGVVGGCCAPPLPKPVNEAGSPCNSIPTST